MTEGIREAKWYHVEQEIGCAECWVSIPLNFALQQRVCLCLSPQYSCHITTDYGGRRCQTGSFTFYISILNSLSQSTIGQKTSWETLPNPDWPIRRVKVGKPLKSMQREQIQGRLNAQSNAWLNLTAPQCRKQLQQPRTTIIQILLLFQDQGFLSNSL